MALPSGADSLVHCRSVQRNNHEKVELKLESLDEKLEQTSKIQEAAITQLQSIVESGITRTQITLSDIQSDLKGGWWQQIGTEFKCIVSQIFQMSGTTLDTVQRIKERLQSRSMAALARTFTFEDALGRVTQIDMVYVSSWDAFEGMLEACFRDCPGHDKVAKKDYVFQDQMTSEEL
jgi:hypothetical protein